MLERIKSVRHDIVLIVLACFALAWVVARACVQSVTIDEADSYLGFVTSDWRTQWYPSSGNHVLNTILMRIFTDRQVSSKHGVDVPHVSHRLTR